MTPSQAPVWSVELLKDHHDLTCFSCGVDSLDRFLKNTAREAAKAPTGTTYVVVPGGSAVHGYYTLAMSSVEVGLLPEDRRKRLPATVPAVRIGRLAVQQSTQGQGLGGVLLMDALTRSYRVSREIAAYVICVDALDSEKARYYERFGFSPFFDTTTHLFLPMKAVPSLNAG